MWCWFGLVQDASQESTSSTATTWSFLLHLLHEHIPEASNTELHRLLTHSSLLHPDLHDVDLRCFIGFLSNHLLILNELLREFGEDFLRQ